MSTRRRQPFHHGTAGRCGSTRSGSPIATQPEPARPKDCSPGRAALATGHRCACPGGT